MPLIDEYLLGRYIQSFVKSQPICGPLGPEVCQMMGYSNQRYENFDFICRHLYNKHFVLQGTAPGLSGHSFHCNDGEDEDFTIH